MPEPLDSLKSLASTPGSTPRAGYTAAGARRRGTQIRRRRIAVQAVGGVAAVTAVIGGVQVTASLVADDHPTIAPAVAAQLPADLPMTRGWTPAGDAPVTASDPIAPYVACSGGAVTLQGSADRESVGLTQRVDLPTGSKVAQRARDAYLFTSPERAERAVTTFVTAFESCPEEPGWTWQVDTEGDRGTRIQHLPARSNKRADGFESLWVVREGNAVVISSVKEPVADRRAALVEADRRQLEPLLERLR